MLGGVKTDEAMLDLYLACLVAVQPSRDIYWVSIDRLRCHGHYLLLRAEAAFWDGISMCC